MVSIRKQNIIKHNIISGQADISGIGKATWGKIIGDIKEQLDLTNYVKEQLEGIDSYLSNYYNKSEVVGLIGDLSKDVEDSLKLCVKTWDYNEFTNQVNRWSATVDTRLSNIYTKSESDSKYQPYGDYITYDELSSELVGYQPKGDYLTEHQSLSDYYTKSEVDVLVASGGVPDLSSYYTKSEIENIRRWSDVNKEAQNIDVYAEQHINIASPDIHFKNGFRVDGFISGNENVGYEKFNGINLGQYTGIMDLYEWDGLYRFHYYLGDDKDVVIAEITKDGIKENGELLSDKYQPKGDYLTEHQSLSDYYTKSEVDTLISNSGGGSGSGTTYETINSVGKIYTSIFAVNKLNGDTVSHIDVTTGGIGINSLNDITVETTKGSLYLFSGNTASLEGYNVNITANKKEGDSTSGIINLIGDKLYFNAKEVATVDDIPTVPDFPDLNDYLTKKEGGDLYQPKGSYLTQHQSLANYYTKSEIDSTIGDIENILKTI